MVCGSIIELISVTEISKICWLNEVLSKVMKGYLVVEDYHHYIVSNDEVIENIKEFLRTGKFLESNAPVSSVPSSQ